VNDRVTPGPFTAVFLQGDGKIVAYIEELPETIAEGATIEEAEASLTVELALTLAANRWMTHESFAGARVIRRAPFTVGKRE
jgi:predicted RNase H-like HicB family nuclease